MTASTHPLFGDRLSASSFKRWRGELLLVVRLPDGSSGTIRADATDVFGDAEPEPGVVSTLSVDGVRQLQVVTMGVQRRRRRGRPKPWKVVRHAHGVDPFEGQEWVYSAHTTELAAARARGRVRAVMARSSGVEVAERWAWSVVHDPADVLDSNRS